MTRLDGIEPHTAHVAPFLQTARSPFREHDHVTSPQNPNAGAAAPVVPPQPHEQSPAPPPPPQHAVAEVADQNVVQKDGLVQTEPSRAEKIEAVVVKVSESSQADETSKGRKSPPGAALVRKLNKRKASEETPEDSDGGGGAGEESRGSRVKKYSDDPQDLIPCGFDLDSREKSVSVPQLSVVDKAKLVTVSREETESGTHWNARGKDGFRSVRATHAVIGGRFYYEVDVKETDAPAHVRIGISSHRFNVELPVGADEFSYGIRDKTGQLFHNAEGFDYGVPFTGPCTIGVLVSIPLQRLRVGGGVSEIKAQESAAVAGLETRLSVDLELLSKNTIQPTLGSRAHEAYQKYAECLQNAESDSVTMNLADVLVYNERLYAEWKFWYNLHNHQKPVDFGSLIQDQSATLEFFKDGQSMAQEHNVAWKQTGLPLARYFATISVFKNAQVAVNFGPRFKHFPQHLTDDRSVRPYCDASLIVYPK